MKSGYSSSFESIKHEKISSQSLIKSSGYYLKIYCQNCSFICMFNKNTFFPHILVYPSFQVVIQRWEKILSLKRHESEIQRINKN